MSGRPPPGAFVYALAVLDNEVYAGGFFTRAGGVRATNIAKWNGTAWMPLSSGMNGATFALAIWDGDVYAGGSFSAAGGSIANYVAKWDGSSWSGLASGMDWTVRALVVS